MITVLWEEQWLSTLQDLHSGKPHLVTSSFTVLSNPLEQAGFD